MDRDGKASRCRVIGKLSRNLVRMSDGIGVSREASPMLIWVKKVALGNMEEVSSSCHGYTPVAMMRCVREKTRVRGEAKCRLDNSVEAISSATAAVAEFAVIGVAPAHRSDEPAPSVIESQRPRPSGW